MATKLQSWLSVIEQMGEVIEVMAPFIDNGNATIKYFCNNCKLLKNKTNIM